MKKRSFIIKNGQYLSLLMSLIVITITLWQRFNSETKMYAPATAFSYYMIHWINTIFGYEFQYALILCIIVNIIFVMFMTWLFYVYTKKIFGDQIAFFSTSIFILSPAYIFSIAAFTTMPVVLTIFLASLFLFYSIYQPLEKGQDVKKGFLYGILMFICLWGIWLLDNMTGIFAFIVLLCFLIYIEHRNRTIQQGTSLLAKMGKLRYALFILTIISIFFSIKYASLNIIFMYLINVRLFANFDGQTGLGVILLVLGFVGYIEGVYDKKDVFKNLITAIVLVGTIVLVGLTETPILWGTALLACVAGILIRKLETKKWTIESMKFLTLLLIFCIFLFSFISYMKDIGEITPTDDLLDVKLFIEDIAIDGKIMAAPQDAYILGSPNVIYPNINEAFLDNGTLSPRLTEMMRYRVLNQVQPFLEERNIRFIVLPKDIEDDAFWLDETRRGLLFIMENSKYFITVHATPTYDIWLYVPRDTK